MRIGIIGAGAIAQRFAQALNGIGIKPYAIASRDKDKAKSYQETFGFEKAYQGYDALYEDPKVQCVYIATPHSFHAPEMLKALRHHKHVICEKPFTLNAEQAREVFTLAQKHNLFVMEAMKTRFLPVIKAVKSAIDAGEIGEIKEANATFSSTDGHPRLYDPALGGGALLDIGVYSLHLFDLILGAPRAITSRLTMHENGIDSESVICSHYDDCDATLKVSLKDPLKKEATFEGTKGRIVIPHFSSAVTAHVYDSAGTCVRTIEQPHRVNGFEYQIEAAVDAVKDNMSEHPLMPHRATLRVLALMDDVRRQWKMVFPGETL